MKSSIRRHVVLAFASLSLLVSPSFLGDADAQPMRPPEPGQAQPGQPGRPQPGQPGRPGGQPGQPGGQPGRPPGMGQPGQPGQPPPGPGRQPPRRPLPGQPGQGEPPFPGHPPIPGQKPVGLMPEPKHEAAHEEHCPGHGPNDSPPHINWYQGILGVNNAKSQSPSFLDRLLWRYDNPKDECDAKNQPPPLLGSVINFAIVAFVLFRFGKGPVIEGLAKRKKTIMADIDAATELRRAAEKRLKDYEKQLAKIETRRDELRAESRLAWETERERLLLEAEERGARLRRDAELRVEQELKQAESDLLREAVDGAVAAAEQLLKTRVQAADQERLADEFAQSLGASLASKAARPAGERRSS